MNDIFCCVANVLQISDKHAHNKGIRNENPINAKSVQLTRAARFCLLFIMCLPFGITSPPQRLSPLNINVLYLYGTNMDAYDDR